MNYFLEITGMCVSCDNCRLICPEDSIFKNKNEYVIETWSCSLCNACIEVCPVDCIKETTIDDQ